MSLFENLQGIARPVIDNLNFIITENSERLNAFIRYSSVWTFWRTPETPTLLRCSYRISCALTTATLTRVTYYWQRPRAWRDRLIYWNEAPKITRPKQFSSVLWIMLKALSARARTGSGINRDTVGRDDDRYSIMIDRWLYRAIKHDAPYVKQVINRSFTSPVGARTSGTLNK